MAVDNTHVDNAEMLLGFLIVERRRLLEAAANGGIGPHAGVSFAPDIVLLQEQIEIVRRLIKDEENLVERDFSGIMIV